MPKTKIIRCAWCGSDPLYIQYHDEEWGVPVHDDRKLFEMLILDGMQAGLSWITVLRKREEFRKAFDGFDPARIARYEEAKIQELLGNPGIIRNRLKIQSAVRNAQAFLEIQKEFGAFDRFLWSFVGDKPRQNHFTNSKQIPARTLESDRMSKELKKRGFSFVGSTICYAFMQAAGMVNDHLADCFRYREVRRKNRLQK
jgi:DNA-3-methyladenine glycosylase I